MQLWKVMGSVVVVGECLAWHFFFTFACFNFLGTVYNIPICLWLLDTYPYNPPICFVKPTSAMMIKTGKHVDANGKIYLPYLHEWKYVSWLILHIGNFFVTFFHALPR